MLNPVVETLSLYAPGFRLGISYSPEALVVAMRGVLVAMSVSVTLALMGLTYHLLPRLGYGQPSSKWATIQPWLYAGGQLLHIVGLAWLGSYGVQRKVADATQGMTGVESAARGLMGLGGLLAIIGGLVFLAVVYRAMRRR